MKKRATTTSPASSSPVAQPLAASEPPGGWPPDEFTGLAGRYIRDPITGVRRPADPNPEKSARKA